LEVKVDFSITAHCHPSDVWEKFCRIEEWKDHTEIFGEAGWVHGKPWAHHSRFFIEMIKPEREDFEVVVLKSAKANEVILLSHGGGLAGEQWISVEPQGPDHTVVRTSIAVVGASPELAPKLGSRLKTIFTFWFGGLAAEAERHCSAIAL
jgi:hypothetical protein